MAVPAYKATGTGVNVAGGNAVTPTYPATVDANDLAVLLTHVKNDADATLDQPAGWATLFADITNGGDSTGVYYRTCDGTEDGATVTVPRTEPTPGGRRGAYICTFSGGAGTWAIEDQDSQLQTTASTTVSDNDVTTSGTDRLAINLIAYSNRQTGGQEALAGESGGTWVAQTLAYYEGGNNPTLSLQTADMASAGTVGGGSDTSITSSTWTVVGFAIYIVPAAGGQPYVKRLGGIPFVARNVGVW